MNVSSRIKNHHKEKKSTPEQQPNRKTKTIYNFNGVEKKPSVLGLRILPNGPHYAFDEFFIEDQVKRILTIGAGLGCDITLNDAAVSNLHCCIERRLHHVLVRDCNSKNGIRVNGTPVTIGELTPGSLLTIGRTMLASYSTQYSHSHVLIAASNFTEFLNNAVETHGSLRSTAEALGLPYSTLRGWLKKRNDPKLHNWNQKPK